MTTTTTYMHDNEKFEHLYTETKTRYSSQIGILNDYTNAHSNRINGWGFVVRN